VSSCHIQQDSTTRTLKVDRENSNHSIRTVDLWRG